MDTTSQLLAALASQSLPVPSQSLLASLTARSPTLPLASLLATARARLLAADLTSSAVVDTSQPCFPAGADSANVTKGKLLRDTHVQVLDVENLSLSRWEQIEEMEAVERGERTRGREVIRVTDESQGEDGHGDGDGTRDGTRGQAAGAGAQGAAALHAGKNATHRLVVQDCKGTRVYAVELRRIDGIGVGKTSIGCKMLLRAGTALARGTVLLTGENCVLLGGRIDAWHEAWTKGRMARLKEATGAGDGDATA